MMSLGAVPGWDSWQTPGRQTNQTAGSSSDKLQTVSNTMLQHKENDVMLSAAWQQVALPWKYYTNQRNSLEEDTFFFPFSEATANHRMLPWIKEVKKSCVTRIRSSQSKYSEQILSAAHTKLYPGNISGSGNVSSSEIIPIYFFKIQSPYWPSGYTGDAVQWTWTAVGDKINIGGEVWEDGMDVTQPAFGTFNPKSWSQHFHVHVKQLFTSWPLSLSK